MIALTDFRGAWRLSRRIDDRRGPAARFEGRATLTPQGRDLRYCETGVLTLDGQGGFEARRGYLWRGEGALIRVVFDDGRPFHSFDPAQPVPGDTHLCGADTYVVTYDLTDWPRWRVRWAVTGPRKDYRMVSCYAPVADAETGEPRLGGQ